MPTGTSPLPSENASARTRTRGAQHGGLLGVGIIGTWTVLRGLASWCSHNMEGGLLRRRQLKNVFVPMVFVFNRPRIAMNPCAKSYSTRVRSKAART